MKGRLWDYIQENHLFKPDDKILLTVSGGIDSSAMVHLFQELRFDFGIAHCNFNLRGIESDQDEKFVQKLAKQHHVSFHLKSFKTKEFSHQKKLSTQMAARQLRYQWFEEVRNKFNYKYIATAHNKNDQAETLLLNLIRGTGIRGLTGMRPSTGNIIRPLLFLSREEIQLYVSEKELDFREDSSNISIRYKRNFIRHNILPLLSQLNPSIIDTLADEASWFQEINDLVGPRINAILNELIEDHDDRILLNIQKLLATNNSKLLLYEHLKKYGFSGKSISDIHKALFGTSGLTFYSESHRIVKDRNSLIITPNITDEVNSASPIYIQEDCTEISYPIHLKLVRKTVDKKYIIPKSRSIAVLDLKLIDFPLEIRRWKDGDSFHPLGMKGRKKLSDFFTDIKLSKVDKEKVWLLCSSGTILWVVNHRIDDHFKLTDSTHHVIEIHLIESKKTIYHE